MQKSLRLDEMQLIALSQKAIKENSLQGYLCSRNLNKNKWQNYWYVLYQNLLFYFENEYKSRPIGVIFLEGSYCDKSIQHASGKNSPLTITHCFTITYSKEKTKQFEFRTKTETESDDWIQAIELASFSKVLSLKEELEQKNLHLIQIVEAEKIEKWQYTQQCEDLTSELKKLSTEMCSLKKKCKLNSTPNLSFEDESEEIRKVKKVQSFFRGWMCRRRWKQIVADYINSPHAENMRKRNSLVFRMVEAEEEYVDQLNLLISCYLRPFKMAASSQKPPCTHDEVNSIFLNSETIMFLHQIFLKGLTARMENWPTLVLGDLFDMLLPMLVIYQEYVRNHHFSLQVLAECKQKQYFNKVLKRLEEKPILQSRCLETFLTYPMHQVPRYIVTLHELLAHTPHNHVERKSLELAKTKLEELSRQMHDEVSETESIRKNLAIERIIVGGCDILLDVNQVFVRQGSLIQVISSNSSNSSSPISFGSSMSVRIQRARLGSFRNCDKEVLRQCFLFSNHILICSRNSNGKLNIIENIGKIPLSETTLIEDTSEKKYRENIDFSNKVKDFNGNDFKMVWDSKNNQTFVLHFVAPSKQEKAAWITDILQVK